MKILLAPALLFLFSNRGEEVVLQFAPEAHASLRRTFLAEAEYHLADLTGSVDGEVMDRPEEIPAYSTSFTEHIQVLDTLEACDGGRPTEFTRTFEVLRQENSEALDGEESSIELSSSLQGRRLRFEYDGGEAGYHIKADDEEDLEQEQAEWLAADMDLLLLLPDHEVEPGDEWEVDPKLYLAFMWPSGLLDFHSEEEDPSAEDRLASQQTIEHLEGSGRARLKEVREEGEVLVAVIHLELGIKTGSSRVWPPSEEEGLERPEVTAEVHIERQVAGTIVWDIQGGHALSAELDCQASRLVTESFMAFGQHDGEGAEVLVEQGRLLEGRIRYEARIERE